jgi:spermidine/putrescine transport system ATP-binding protein
VTRRFGDREALRDVNLSIHRGEFFSLLGPSGCGKTTLLRIIAGLDFPDAGTVHLAARDAGAIPPHQRPVNTVFQNYALFPHLDVQGNVSFGLRMKKLPRDEIARRVQAALDLVRIGDLASRRPQQLSGGEKQRVALARALVNEPEVLLLDEPLAALDLKLRKELQAEMRTLQRRTGITFIYVTHDQDEALSMSDRIAVMDAGQIVQTGTSRELYEQPRTRFVAHFLGGCNLFPATVAARSGRRVTAHTPVGLLEFETDDPRDAFMLAVRPENIVPATSAGTNHVSGVIVDTTYTGAETQSTIEAGECQLRVVTSNRDGASPGSIGSRVAFTVPPHAIVVLED